ncbi:ferredoxin [Amycolatopsis ultiminotia]|uniref:Ferredoxin n=1 Tax=Amycolatopsis ultiminotia TaxID=543629 RepID=A0ABP6UYH0_9PSEU
MAGTVIRIAIDSDRCQGHARCAVRAPELFDVDDDQGKSIALVDTVPPGLREAADEAVETCPERAISLHDE